MLKIEDPKTKKILSEVWRGLLYGYASVGLVYSIVVMYVLMKVN